MKGFLRIVCVINMIGMFFGFVAKDLNIITLNGFCAVIMAILSNND